MRTAVLLSILALLGVAIWLAGGLVPPAPDPTSPDAAQETSPSSASPVPDRPARAGPEAPSEPVGAWPSPAVCRECHPQIHARWSGTGHALTIRDATPETVRKPMDGDVFRARGIAHELGPGMTMECEGPGGERRRFALDWVIGLRRIQMFTTRLDDGRIQVLPVFLEVPKSRWFDYTDFIFGTPDDFTVPADSTFSWYGPHRNYNSRCGRCHMTNYEIGYDPDAGTYDTTWSERVVACGSCHGPGGAHVEHWRARASGPDPIVNPAKLDVERANHVCGQCHAEGHMVAPGFRPGDDLFRFFDVAGLEDTTHLMPDAKAGELIHALVPTMTSRCGPIRCTQCHDPHGRGIPGDLYRPLDDDWTCTQCHEEIAADLEAHTHHPAESAGSRCVNCHMQPLVIEGGHGRVRDHTISIPSIANTDKWGLPNACRTCHLTELPGWEYDTFREWYPDADERNHRVALADALAGARARRPEAREGLRRLLADDNPVYRAGAAWWLAAYGEDLRETLIGDPHPFVRRAAIHGVAFTHPEALAPLLDDDNPVLRRAAALALAERRVRQPYDFLRTRPELRDRVLAALEATLGLRPDDADAWYAAAMLYRQAGRGEEAEAALERHRRLSW